jgi:hypothetical protein
MPGEYHNTTSSMAAGDDTASSFIFCREGGNVVLPDPADAAVDKGTEYGSYYRMIHVIAVGTDDCTVRVKLSDSARQAQPVA